MHVLFVTNSVITKHATMKRAFGLAPGLLARGCRITICLEDHPDNRAEVERLAGCSVHYYQRGSLREEYCQKAKFIRDCDCDVVHICGLGWRNALLRRATYPPFLMDHVELESSLPASPFLKRASQLLLEWASLFAYRNAVMASDYLRATFEGRARRLGLHPRAIVLPYASDIPNHEGLPGANQIRLLRHGKQVILYMGGLYKSYGCLDIVKALHRLREFRQDWHAILAGRGPEAEQIAGMIEQFGLQGCVELPGYTTGKSLDALLAAADLFLCPLYDTVADKARCPGKTYIYMMYGKPIVTCPVGETHKALGSNGFYYAPGDIESMAQAMGLALDVAPEWRPTYDRSAHTWDARAETYLCWLRSWIPRQCETEQNAA